MERLEEKTLALDLDASDRLLGVPKLWRLKETYSAACAGFKIACNGSTVEPSEISAKAKRFCFRTERMNPLTLISWSSRLHVPSFLLAWRTCAHRRTTGRELTVGLWPSLAIDVAKVRRHVCMAKSRALQSLEGNDGGCGREKCRRSCSDRRTQRSTLLVSPGLQFLDLMRRLSRYDAHPMSHIIFLIIHMYFLLVLSDS